MAAAPRPQPKPSTREEQALWAAGYKFVAGVDEVGMGPLAGPVFTAAVILDPNRSTGRKKYRWLSEVNDSKVMPAPDRERLAEVIKAECVSYAIAWSTVAEIDALNIRQANFLAMRRAVNGLGVQADHLLVDGPWAIGHHLPHKSIVDGDALVSSIAAASIVAKVARDAFMCNVSRFFPEWRFHEHKGYSTPDHLARIAEYGASSQHRRSWLAVRRRAGLPIEGDEADVTGLEDELVPGVRALPLSEQGLALPLSATESVTIPEMYLRKQPSPTPTGRAPSSRRAGRVATTNRT
jgi:ribonuclease HII